MRLSNSSVLGLSTFGALGPSPPPPPVGAIGLFFWAWSGIELFLLYGGLNCRRHKVPEKTNNSSGESNFNLQWRRFEFISAR
jgi:hypothetical protein